MQYKKNHYKSQATSRELLYTSSFLYNTLPPIFRGFKTPSLLQLFNVWTVTFNTLETSFRVKYSVSSPVIDNLFNGFPIARIPVAREVAPQV